MDVRKNEMRRKKENEIGRKKGRQKDLNSCVHSVSV
jgi:hypothetical protein